MAELAECACLEIKSLNRVGSNPTRSFFYTKLNSEFSFSKGVKSPMLLNLRGYKSKKRRNERFFLFKVNISR